MSLRIRRGTEIQRSGIVFDMGEIVWTTDSQQIWVGDGITQGGINILSNSAGVGLFYNPTTKKIDFAGASYTTDDIAEGTTLGRQYFTVERAQDAVASMFTSGTHTGITFQYNDNGTSNGVINAVVTIGEDNLGIHSVSADTSPELGGDLSLNNNDINGTGNIDITGSITATSFGTVTTSQLLSTSTTPPTAGVTTDNVISLGSLTSPTTLWNFSDHTHAVWTGLTNTADINTAFYARQVRGSLIAPEAVAPGDIIYRVNAQGYDGTGFSTLVGFGCQVDPDGVVSTGKVPGKFVITTYDSAGAAKYTTVNSANVLSTGKISVDDGTAGSPSIRFGSDASTDTGFFHPGDGIVCISTNAVEKVRVDGGGMRVDGFMKVKDVNGTLPSPAEAGMIVLDGSTFKGYNGSTWVTLG